jgi:hypothetical protein
MRGRGEGVMRGRGDEMMRVKSDFSRLLIIMVR